MFSKQLIISFTIIAMMCFCLLANGETMTDQAQLSSDKKQQKPNIVLIVTDDQGYGDFKQGGNTVVHTPNINKLVAESTLLTNFHVDPTCSPTRAALMTGRHSMRAGVWHTTMGRSLMPNELVTMPEILKDSGYSTAIFGKWHLGDNYPFRPQDQGFDYSLIHGGGGVGQTADLWGNTQFDDTYLRNGHPEGFSGYTGDIWFKEASEYIRKKQQSQQPFFVYIATNAPHRPWRAPEKFIKPYLDQGLPEDVARFYAMITATDVQIGNLRQQLTEQGLADNTIFIVMSDNGSALDGRKNYFGSQGFSVFKKQIKQQFPKWQFNANLRGYKTDVYDGGHRVPLVIHWPRGQLNIATTIDSLTAHYDILPTLIELTNINYETEKLSLDGQSFAELLSQEQQTKLVFDNRAVVITNQRLFIPQKDRPAAVLTNRWRYILNSKTEKEALYDIQEDPSQQHNVLAHHAEVAKSLSAVYDNWWLDVTEEGIEENRIIIGNKAENPVRLTAMDWMEAPSTSAIPWNPGFQPAEDENPYANWLTKETSFKPLPWYVDVEESGLYQIAIFIHDKPASMPLAKRYAFLMLNDQKLKTPISGLASHAIFNVKLAKGPLDIKGWFSEDVKGEKVVVPSFYSYVEKRPNN